MELSDATYLHCSRRNGSDVGKSIGDREVGECQRGSEGERGGGVKIAPSESDGGGAGSSSRCTSKGSTSSSSTGHEGLCNSSGDDINDESHRRNKEEAINCDRQTFSASPFPHAGQTPQSLAPSASSLPRLPPMQDHSERRDEQNELIDILRLRTPIRFIATLIGFCLCFVFCNLCSLLSLIVWILSTPILLIDQLFGTNYFFTLTETLTSHIFAFSAFCIVSLFPVWKKQLIRPPDGKFSPFRRPTIIMSNHLSNADGFILLSMFFSLCWSAKVVYKSSLQAVPFFGWSMVLSQQIPIYFTKDRGGWGTRPGSISLMMRRCLKLIEEANVPLLVFPEGTRSQVRTLQSFKDGFFRFAVENGIEICPVILHNTDNAWPRGSVMPDLALIKVAFGEPVPPPPLTLPVSSSDEAYSPLSSSSRSDQYWGRKYEIDEGIEILKTEVRSQMIHLLNFAKKHESDQAGGEDVELVQQKRLGALNRRLRKRHGRLHRDIYRSVSESPTTSSSPSPAIDDNDGKFCHSANFDQDEDSDYSDDGLECEVGQNSFQAMEWDHQPHRQTVRKFGLF